MNQAKICESCGMPIDEKSVSKFNDIYCIYCEDQDNGTLATKDQVREGSVKAIMGIMGKTREEAEKITDETMSGLPRWKK